MESNLELENQELKEKNKQLQESLSAAIDDKLKMEEIVNDNYSFAIEKINDLVKIEDNIHEVCKEIELIIKKYKKDEFLTEILHSIILKLKEYNGE